MGQGGNIAMSNATSYDWNLTHQHSYQMNTWSFPEKISAGTQGSCYIEFSEGISETLSDDAGEAQYTLSGTNFSFTVQARFIDGYGHSLKLYLDSIEILDSNPKETINLGWNHDGTIEFTISGGETNQFVLSYEPPPSLPPLSSD